VLGDIFNRGCDFYAPKFIFYLLIIGRGAIAYLIDRR